MLAEDDAEMREMAETEIVELKKQLPDLEHNADLSQALQCLLWTGLRLLPLHHQCTDHV